MEGRIGKMTVTAWLYLPEEGDHGHEITDGDAGKLALHEIGQAVHTQNMIMGGSSVLGLEIIEDAAEATPEEISALEERVHVEAARVAAILAEDEVTV